MCYLCLDCIYARLVDSNVFRHHIVFRNRQVSEAIGVTVLHKMIKASLPVHKKRTICRLNLCQLHFYGLKLLQALQNTISVLLDIKRFVTLRKT